MNNEQMANKYLELIRQNKNHSEEMIIKIMIKYKMKNSIELVIALGNYLDSLSDIRENADYFLKKHTDDYDIIENNNDDEWNEIESELIASGEII